MLQGDHQSELRHHLFRFRFTELNQIYIFNVLRSTAFTFIVIFIPIYLLRTGYALPVIFSYYLTFYLLEAATDFLTARLIRLYGPKHVIAASVPFFIIHFWQLLTLAEKQWPLFFVSATGAIGVGLFWQAYHYDFSMVKTKKKASSEVSHEYILIYLVGMFAPFIGGYLSDRYGTSVTFGLVIFLLLVATIPLFATGDRHVKKRKLDFSLIHWHCVKKDMISYAGRGFEVFAAMIIWPLFIYAIAGNYRAVGAVVTVSLLLGAVITYFTGKSSDASPTRKEKYLKYGGALSGVIYFAHTLVNSLFGVYLAHIARTLAGAITNAPWDSEYYLHADEESRSEYLLVMEVAVDVGRVLMALTMLILSLYLPVQTVLIIGLILGGLGAFTIGLMPLARCEQCVPKPKKIRLAPQPRKVARAKS